jgi:conjugal transfer/type IV secretion protein DotA/TraY
LLDPGSALAQSASSASTSSPIDLFREPGKDDVFFNMLGYVVPGIGPVTGSPTNGHLALGRGFMAFSAVLMLFSSMMLSWHVLVGVVASAYSGKVLGERWHQIWAPGRVVLGLGSLAPIANGYGAAQVLVVYLMVWGGNLANTIWVPYLTELGNGLNPSSVQASPYPTNLDNTSTQQDNRGAVVAKLAGADDVIFQIGRREVCAATMAKYFEVNGSLASTPSSGGGDFRPIFKQPADGAGMTSSYNVAATAASVGAWMFSKAISVGTNQSLSVTSTEYKYDYGSVCGSVAVTVESIGMGSSESLQARQLAAGTRFDTARKDAVEAAAKAIRPWAKKVAETYVANGTASNAFDQSKSDNVDLQNEGLRILADAVKQYREGVMKAAQEEIQALDTTKGGKSLVKTLVDEASAKGWATAGTYYITLGQVQGAAYARATARPSFEDITLNVSSGMTDGWTKSLVGSTNEPGALSGFEAFWNDNQRQGFSGIDPDSARAGRMSRSAESPLDAIMQYLGTDMLMTTTVNWMADLNPFNPMKSMIDFGHLILNIFYWILALMIGTKLLSMFGPLSSGLGKLAGTAAGTMSSAFSSLATSSAPIVAFLQMILIAIFSVGIIHAYVLPMVPFIQVLFFIIGLLTLLIEALIAAPLWAFFHIRMDGQELVDNVQRPGYMIAFNLLLRPGLMILGLIMSMFVFGAVSWFISKTYTVAVVAAGGEHSVGPIGTIVMLVILTFLHYQTALRSFSLINQVPDRVSRWFGQGGENLGESHDNERAVGFAVGQIANRTEGTLRAGGVGGAARNGTPPPKLPGLPSKGK